MWNYAYAQKTADLILNGVKPGLLGTAYRNLTTFCLSWYTPRPS